MLYNSFFWIGFACASGIFVLAIIIYATINRIWEYTWHDVVDLDPDSQDDHWCCCFILDGNEAGGYVTKCPPSGLSVKNLEVRIKHFNEERGQFHLFWRIKETNSKS